MGRDTVDIGKGSGSEILSAPAFDGDAVHPDKLRGYIPEPQTFGKGVGQSANDLPDGANHLFITIVPFHAPERGTQ